MPAISACVAIAAVVRTPALVRASAGGFGNRAAAAAACLDRWMCDALSLRDRVPAGVYSFGNGVFVSIVSWLTHVVALSCYTTALFCLESGRGASDDESDLYVWGRTRCGSFLGSAGCPLARAVLTGVLFWLRCRVHRRLR